jgi:hypothetical protein
MAIHADHNLYRGINAHLNSILQNEPGGWQSFHSVHVTHLCEALDAKLPQGYFARAEKTLQISETAGDTHFRATSSTTPDVTVFRAAVPTRLSGAAVAEATPPTQTIPLATAVTEADYLTGIVIYQAGEGGLLGKPVTRIELLSPANKPGGTHAGSYALKRTETLESGLRLVEIDYLHQSPPVIRELPRYTAGADGAYPYLILVSDPRPTFSDGKTAIYGFVVDEVMPTITIPLANMDKMTLNMGAVYNHTFASSRFFQMVVDYDQEPPRMETYTSADRERIRERMAAAALVHKSEE